MSKSYVTMEQAICPVCGKAHDTGSILLDSRMRNTFNNHTPTHFDMCKEHQKLYDSGFVALVSVDAGKSDITIDDNGKSIIKPEGAYRTGKIMHVKFDALAAILNIKLPGGLPLMFVEGEVIDHLNSMYVKSTGSSSPKSMD